jgi:hypothetical protein
MTTISEWLKVDEDYDSLSTEDKLDNLLGLMGTIVEYDKRRFWRQRYASEEQLAEEYPEDYEEQLSIAWALIKQSYLNYFQDFNDLPLKLEGSKKEYFDILKKFGEDDLDNILLEGE